ncbi:MAG: cyanobactin biosynthesis system PatB/AcyB/McaB family protein [Okeania sp. SIO3C4]|nr:cyanobactin biosynthesis system PatB/AcyB/McaB family protein [Okeania sp. SIO3B3]NER04879.1 cyanobactin biosynthesis system PatB/AcyB/McaB family protein [Okeania sp. SIO3C4]
MRLPKQLPPVKRPDIISPSLAVDVVHGRGEGLVTIRMDLMHGANYNDPAPYNYPTYNQIKSSGWGR